MTDPKTESRVLGGMLNDPAFACGSVVSQYAGPALAQWRAITAVNVSDDLEATIAAVQGGDLAALEAMLVSQAFALQAMFTDLANRARGQSSRDAVNQLTGLALKAQSQSRSTVQALAEMKAPRTTAFVRQTNIAHGAQQVNNGVEPAREPARAREEISEVPNKQIAMKASNGETIVDDGTTRTSSRGDPAAQTLASFDRPAKSGRKGNRVA